MGWEKVVWWSTKAEISPKRVEKVEKLLWKAYIGNQQRSFERHHPRPPTASSFPRLGVRNPTQNSNRYYLRNGRMKLEVQIWQEHSQGPSKQKPIKNFGKKGMRISACTLYFKKLESLSTCLPLIVWVYLHSNVCSELLKTHLWCNGERVSRSGSSKVDDFGTNRKLVCDFLLVRHCILCSYLAPSLRYGDLLA